MDYQKELILFLEHFAPNQSQDVRDAVELDASFHVINVPKLLAVKGLSENYVFRLKDSWNAWKAAKAQAVPEGFVLVPMVPSERMINAVRQCYEGEAYLPYSLYSEFVNQAIIERMEAQEQAND